MDTTIHSGWQSSGLPDWPAIFAAIRDPSDYDPPSGPIIIGKPADVPGAVAKAQRRKRRAPPYAPETLAAFDTTAPEVRE